MALLVEFQPTFYLGWIIQPTIEGFEVYQRLDTSKPHSHFFSSAKEAGDFVHKNTKLDSQEEED